MATHLHSRWWFALGLGVAVGLVFTTVVQRWGSIRATDEPEPQHLARSRDAAPHLNPPLTGDEDGPPARRIFDGCEPVEAALAYEEFVGERALVTLSWSGMAERAANLEIPVGIAAIQDGAIHLRFIEFPMRDQYIYIWIASGHIEPGPEDTFLLDPCSAKLAPWPDAK